MTTGVAIGILALGCLGFLWLGIVSNRRQKAREERERVEQRVRDLAKVEAFLENLRKGGSASFDPDVWWRDTVLPIMQKYGLSWWRDFSTTDEAVKTLARQCMVRRQLLVAGSIWQNLSGGQSQNPERAADELHEALNKAGAGLDAIGITEEQLRAAVRAIHLRRARYLAEQIPFIDDPLAISRTILQMGQEIEAAGADWEDFGLSRLAHQLVVSHFGRSLAGSSLALEPSGPRLVRTINA